MSNCEDYQLGDAAELNARLESRAGAQRQVPGVGRANGPRAR
jgi:hypothetical protein